MEGVMVTVEGLNFLWAQSMTPSPSDANGPPEMLARGKRVVIVLVLGLALGFFLWADSSLCVVKNTVGLPCPGCGLSRATLAMLTGDWSAMWAYHPLAPIISPLVIGFVVFGLSRALGFRQCAIPLPKSLPLFWWILGSTILVLWLGRLLGYFGGHPDSFDPWNSQPGRLLHWLLEHFGTNS